MISGAARIFCGVCKERCAASEMAMARYEMTFHAHMGHARVQCAAGPRMSSSKQCVLPRMQARTRRGARTTSGFAPGAHGVRSCFH